MRRREFVTLLGGTAAGWLFATQRCPELGEGNETALQIRR
jgi:hypothetical protein